MTDPTWPSEPEWGEPPSAAWVSDNPEGALAIWELCEGERYYASLVTEEARDAFASASFTPVPAVGSVVCVLQDGRVYIVAPDGEHVTDAERVRLLGTYRDIARLIEADER